MEAGVIVVVRSYRSGKRLGLSQTAGCVICLKRLVIIHSGITVYGTPCETSHPPTCFLKADVLMSALRPADSGFANGRGAHPIFGYSCCWAGF
jgi:hypothetical protein